MALTAGLASKRAGAWFCTGVRGAVMAGELLATKAAGAGEFCAPGMIEGREKSFVLCLRE